MSSERKNIIVFDSGDVYTYSRSHVKPSEWMSECALEVGQITLFQGPVFESIDRDEALSNIGDGDLNELWEWLYGDDRINDRELIEDKYGADLIEFLNLAFPRGLLGNDFDGMMDSVHEVHNTWMDDQYDVSDDSEVVMNGLVEIDWDNVASDYDDNSGKELLEGDRVVYIVEQC